MSRRFYPRNKQARAAFLARQDTGTRPAGDESGPLQFPRNDQSLRDGLAVTGEVSVLEQARENG